MPLFAKVWHFCTKLWQKWHLNNTIFRMLVYLPMLSGFSLEPCICEFQKIVLLLVAEIILEGWKAELATGVVIAIYIQKQEVWWGEVYSSFYYVWPYYDCVCQNIDIYLCKQPFFFLQTSFKPTLNMLQKFWMLLLKIENHCDFKGRRSIDKWCRLLLPLRHQFSYCIFIKILFICQIIYNLKYKETPIYKRASVYLIIQQKMIIEHLYVRSWTWSWYT